MDSTQNKNGGVSDQRLSMVLAGWSRRFFTSHGRTTHTPR